MTTATFSTEEFEAKFEEVRATRGKKRLAKLRELIDEYGEILLEDVTGPLFDKNKSRRNLAVKLLEELTPETAAGRRKLAEILDSMFMARRKTTRESALYLLESWRRIQGKTVPLAKIMPGEFMADVLLKYFDQIDDLLTSYEYDRIAEVMALLELDDARFFEAMDPILDVPFASTRAQAARVIRQRGGTPRESTGPLSPWSEAPLELGIEDIEALLAIGATSKEPFDPEQKRPLSACGPFYSQELSRQWSGKDPQGQIDQVPREVWFVGKHIKWPDEPYLVQDDPDMEAYNVWMFQMGRSQNLDRRIGGKRRLFCIIGSDSYQYLYGIDLLEVEAGQCSTVYKIAHDDHAAWPIGYGLQSFYQWLRFNRPDDAPDPAIDPSSLQLEADTSEVSPRLPDDELHGLASSIDPMIRARVATFLVVPKEILSLLAGDAETKVRQAVAENPRTNVEGLRRLAADPDKDVRDGVAQNPQTDAETLQRLAEDDDEGVRRSVARRRDLNDSIYRILARDSDIEVRRMVAWREDLPAEVWECLVEDSDERVRELLARLKTAPPEILEKLAYDESWKVRHTLSCNPSVSKALLTSLASPEEPERVVRKGVAQNPSVPEEVLRELARDLDKGVRRSVAGKYGAPREVLAMLVEDDDQYVRKSLAENRDTSPDLLAKLGEDESKEVRQTLAANGATPPEVLALLADTIAPRYVELARNHSTPPEVLLRIAKEAQQGNVIFQGLVFKGLGANSNAPVELLEQLLEEGDEACMGLASSQVAPDHIHLALVDHPNVEVRKNLARNRGLSPAICQALAGDENEDVRFNLACNTALTPEVCKKLRTDENPQVRTYLCSNESTPVTMLEDLLRDEDSGVARSAWQALQKWRERE